MADDINNDSLLELYLYESTSLLDSLDDILLSAEEEGDLSNENVNEIFRIMHTIKGSSSMMAYTGIADVSHKTEDLFAGIRNNGLDKEWFDELFDVVLAVSDFLKTEVNKVQEGLTLETEIAPLTAVLLNLTEKIRAGAVEEPKPDLGRMLGGQPSMPPEPEPAALKIPEPAATLSQPEPMASMPQPEPLPDSRDHAPEPMHYAQEPEPVRHSPEPMHYAPGPEPMPYSPEPMRYSPGAEPLYPYEPAPYDHEQEPYHRSPAPVSHLEAYMPEAPEGGRMLGAEPVVRPLTPTEPPEQNEITADISKVTSRAAESAPDERDTCCLHIYFNEGSKMENIRAFMLINKLNEKGTVNRTIPANPEADPDAANAIIEHGFYVSYTTTLFREQIETLVKGTLSVESVSFVRKLPDDAGGAEASARPQKPELRPQPAPTEFVPEYAAPQPPRPEPAQEFPKPQPQPQPAARPAPEQPSQAPPQHPMQWSLPESETLPEYHPPERPVFIDITTQSPEAHVPKEKPRIIYQPDPPTAQIPKEPVMPPAPIMPVQPRPPQGQAEPSQSSIPHANQNIISVELKKLDALLDLVGEIVINESIVTQNPELEGLELTNFNKAAHQLDKLTNELQDTVMSIRMLPVAIVFQRMRRIVRDMSKSLGKEANLILVGEATEVDKTIIDALSDPIMHLIRNSMDHAIETPTERMAAGKSANGHIILSAQNSGGDVIISISDDGKGLDKTMIMNKARARGLLRKPENEYSDKEIFNMLMAPGFSTREDVSEYSGRGVGLDVVKSNIEKIGGSVTIESKVGLGTNVIMKIPLTLAIISCMEIVIGKEIYSIPINNIRESFKAPAGQLIKDPTGCEMIMLRGQAYPIIRLYDTFGCEGAKTSIEDGILVLVDAGDHNACILADRLVGKYQVVVKPLPLFLNRFGVKRSGISGCTIMGTGNISLIINVRELVN